MRLLVAALMLVLPLTCLATDPAVHPLKGQSATTQAQDEAHCHSRSVEASGFDPGEQPTAPSPAPVAGSGARAKGAVVGAAVGAITDNDVDEAAAKGAVAGGIVQRRRNRAATSEAQARNDAGSDAYAAARRACLGERGYRVD